MTMDKLNGVSQAGNVSSANLGTSSAQSQKPIQNIEMPKSNTVKKITQKDTDQALNEPSSSKATMDLLEKSPVGEGNQQSKEEIEALGYTFTQTAYHIGAPVIYTSADGGTITVYNGKGTAERGENERKTVYKNGNYQQETYYDENGKFKKCRIEIMDPITGLREPYGMFVMFYDSTGKRCFISNH